MRPLLTCLSLPYTSCRSVDVFRLVFGPKYVSGFPHVVRWFNQCMAMPEFSKVIGKVEFAKEDAVAPKAPKAEKPKAEKPAAAAEAGASAAPAAAKPSAE